MDHNQFFPYHNRHIVFRLKNGVEQTGVVINDNKYASRGKGTIYKYIPTNKLIFWKKAEQENNIAQMEKYESEIDIEDITWAMILNY